MNTIKETILEKIRNEKLTQRPRLYFTLKVALFAVLSLAILAISIFLFNFILFSIRINSEDELLGFGPRGLLAFLAFFPWSWFLLDLIFIGFLQSLLRRFKFGYQMPVFRLVAVIIGATIVAGFIFDRGTDFNDRLLRGAEGRHAPTSFDRFYRGARRPVPPGSGVCRCTVVDFYQNKMVVADNRFGTTTLVNVVLPLNDSRATTTSLQKGDMVFMAGTMQDGTFYAFGLHKIMPRPDAVVQ